MPIRLCSICHKTFARKSSYDRHVNPDRKNPCRPIHNELHLNPQIPQIAPKLQKVAPKQGEIGAATSATGKNKCRYCQKSFSRKYGLTRHLDRRCKEKNKIMVDREEVYNQLVDQLENKYQKQIQEMKDEISKLKNTKNTNNSINNGQIMTGGENTINTGTIHTTNNTINLIAYGKEDFNNIDMNVFKRAISQGYNSIPALVKDLHFNENYPEYQNAYIPSHKDSAAMVYDGAQWLLTDKNEVIDKMYDDKLDILENKFEEFYDNLNDPIKKRFNRFLTDIDPNIESDTNIDRKVKKKIAMMLYNYKHLPKSTNKKVETLD